MNFSQLASRQRLFAGLIIVVGLLVACFCLFKAKAMSYAKTEPYTIELSVRTNLSNGIETTAANVQTDDNVESAEVGSVVFLSYDYGYGIRDEHIRPLRAKNGRIEETLSVSAWKHIHGLYFIAPKDQPYEVTHLQISKNGVNYEPELPVGGPTLEGENWLYRLPLTDFDYAKR